MQDKIQVSIKLRLDNSQHMDENWIDGYQLLCITQWSASLMIQMDHRHL